MSGVSENDQLVVATPGSGISLISLDFVFSDEADLEVYQQGVDGALLLNTDYTVSGVASDPPTGSITLTTPANGATVYAVLYNPSVSRAGDVPSRAALQSTATNDEFNKIIRMIAALKTKLSRALQLPLVSDVITTIDLGASGSRGGKAIIVNAAEDGYELAETAAWVSAGTWALSTEYAVHNFVSHNGGGYVCILAH